MKCVICKHTETEPGTVIVTLERGGLTYIIKQVPAQVCSDRGEDYVDENITRDLLNSAEEMVKAGTQVEIRQYIAA